MKNIDFSDFNLTKVDFDNYYVPKLKEAIKKKSSCFVVGDYYGADRMAQLWLSENLPEEEHSRVTVYHMFNLPRILESKLFKTIGGFRDDISRDSAMTEISDQDIAFVYPGRWTSGTAQNILRRLEVKPSWSEEKN